MTSGYLWTHYGRVCGINDPEHTCDEYLILFAKLGMTLPDLQLIRPPSTRLVTDHSRSSALSLLLLPQSSSLPTMSHSPPTHHETSNSVSPIWITPFGVSSTEMHRIQIQTKSSQLFITQTNQGTNQLVSYIPWLNQVNYSSHKQTKAQTNWFLIFLVSHFSSMSKCSCGLNHAAWARHLWWNSGHGVTAHLRTPPLPTGNSPWP
jgi:hypothetical protein